MGKKRKQLSEAEIWDDSALVQSWDDALQEYTLYHSIHARGERVEDVLREAATEDETTHAQGHKIHKSTATEGAEGANEVTHDELEEGELKDGEVEADLEAKGVDLGSRSPEDGAPMMQPEHPHQPPNVPPRGLFELPSAIFGGVPDEALKNLMMSWYYAGYYTGLYEGQQQVTKSQSARAVRT